MYQYGDQITNSGTANFAGVAMGSGDDMFTNEVSGVLEVAGDLNLKMGDDTVANHGAMTVTGDLTDINQGTCGNEINKGKCGTSNQDAIENTGTLTVRGDIVLGSGITQDAFKRWSDNDTINNSGTLSVNNINFEKAQATGTDSDTLVNSGTLTATGNITFGRGSDTLINQGTLAVGGSVFLGPDADTFQTDYDFRVGGVIDGGDGEDAVTFGGAYLPDFFSNGVQDGGEVSAANFMNFEFGKQDGGNWDYDGNFSRDARGGMRIDTFELRGGTMRARDENYPIFKNFVFRRGVIDFVKTVSTAPALAVTEQFDYKGGTLYIDARSVESSPDNAPRWKVIEGTVINAEGLAKNTLLVTTGATRSGQSFQFQGLASEGNLTNDGGEGTVAIYPFNYAYLASDSVGGSSCGEGDCGKDFEVRLVPRESPIDPDPEPDYCEQNPGDPLCNGTITPPDPDPEFCEENPNADACKEEPEPEPEPELPGCENEDLCELLPPSPDPGVPDPGNDEVEDIVDILDEEVHDPDSDLDLPLLMDWGRLARLIGSGLAPRNVDAAGRGLQTYNNLLADTIFERLPLRQFTAVKPEPPVVEPLPEQAPIEQAPIRGLWSKSEALTDAQAQQGMAASLAQAENGPASTLQAENTSSDVVYVNGTTYVENPSLTAQYSLRDGWRAWFRGFGGDNRAYNSTTFYNDYSLNAGGATLGADVSLSDSFQIGFYANYGNVNVNQLGDTGGGSWNPDGWGGGVTAEYWTDNFYVQGLIGASSFSGTQERGVLAITEALGDDTASGSKNATSFLGAVRVGAPFQSGGLYLEPQLTATWTNNNENGFTESGIDEDLRLSYGSRTTNYLETALGLKLAFPINSGEFAEWVPNLKLAWLADWDTGNGDQSIGYSFTNRRVDFESQQSNQNGALIEAGLDYTVANLDTTSWKVFAKGGAEIWGGDRGTTWRASGGITFQF